MGSEVKVIPEVCLQVLLRRNKKFRPKSLLETVCAKAPARSKRPDMTDLQTWVFAAAPNSRFHHAPGELWRQQFDEVVIVAA